ncbi:G-type lectin S-receptor-like serine/threonine-protein kinase At1g11410 isoform X2 [Prosopis cineraria]|uniref:G-type lectin S-receptor-like serine/threonine-protein kinase At1g11410 isoform X2 n=1 Tax=Prosopis cineraria TaxID=364024 RepID=UPI0024104F8B|nr:G-type lectin S-receptor-like serine/threonine-protein kinase At1g11410 isoform X2 [Prosopis cineraria]
MLAKKVVIWSVIIRKCFLFCAALDTITINKPLRDGDQLLISKEKKFALGFFTPGKSSNRYVGIWYYNLIEQTVVWVANRDDPMNNTSGILSISSDGNLILHHNNSDMPIWSTNVSVTVPNAKVMAQLTDLGNLVLIQNNSKAVIWQSFDHPTDTLLPYAKLGANKRTGQSWFLRSWKTEEDPGTGSFSVRFNTSGKAQLFMYYKDTPVWRGGSFNGEVFVGIPFIKRAKVNASNMTVTDNDNEISYVYNAFDKTLIVRMVALPAGLFQSLTWDSNKKRWRRYWSAPEGDCDNYGSCGTNTDCDPLDYAKFKCSCLPGFEPKNASRWYQHADATEGCMRKKGPSLCGNGEGFVRVESVKIPDTSVVNANMEMGLEECEKECLRNCSCSAYATADVRNGGSGCLTWYGTLMDTQILSEEGHDLFVRVDAVELAKYAKKPKRPHVKFGKVGIATTSVGLIISLLTALTVYCIWKRKRGDDITELELKLDSPTDQEDHDNNRAQSGLPFFSIKNITTATNNFSNENQLGRGGFGSVYKGLLTGGQVVAVKRLSHCSGQGTREFMNEIKLIAKLQHRNLVKLLGYCIHEKERMLIYEYLPNKSLDFFIFDATMNPKISDFGMARIFGEDQTQAKTRRIAGTYGYMSPEYAMGGQYSTKSDVFSFGILMLEIISGKRNTDHDEARAFLNLIGHVWELWREGKPLEIMDSTLGESYPVDVALRCIQIGLLCVQEIAFHRPSMLEVIFMLGNEVSLPLPQKPAFLLNYFVQPSESSTFGKPSMNNITTTAISGR